MSQAIKIERMAYGSCGVGHLDSGKTVFVEGALSGDVAEIEVVSEKKSFANARVTKIVEPSADRIEQSAGLPLACAPWAGLSYDAQLTEKLSNLKSSLVRIAHIPSEEVDRLVCGILPSPAQWGYRNKIELTPISLPSGKLALGVHGYGDDIVALDANPLGNRLIEKAPKALAGALSYLQGRDDLGVYRVGVRGSVRTGEVEVALWTPPSSFPRGFASKIISDAVGATSVVRVIADPGAARKVKRVERLGGSGCWHEKLQFEGSGANSFAYKVSAPSFFQVNTQGADLLIKLALDAWKGALPDYLADLYSGVGTFSIPLSFEGVDVDAIELEGSSARDFRANAEVAEALGFPGALELDCDDVACALPSLGELGAVIVDPPRMGLDSSVIDMLAEAKPSQIVYVSCDPSTFARDAQRLFCKGYKLTRATALDMFPQTFHVETIGAFAIC